MDDLSFSSQLRVLGIFILRFFVFASILYIVIQNQNQLSINLLEFDVSLILVSALLYPVSFGLILIVWHLIMYLQVGSADWRRDSQIYCYSNLVRNLPLGLFWRLGGRTMLYLQANISSKSTIAASLWEILLHAASAIIILLILTMLHEITVSVWISGLASALIVAMVFIRGARNHLTKDTLLDNLHDVWFRPNSRLLVILVLNSITWLNAGLMLQLLVYAVAPQAEFSYINALQSWITVGLVGYVIFLFPFLDVGMKEATMAMILSIYIPLPASIAVAVLNRLIFMAGDLLCSLCTLSLIHWKANIVRTT